MSLGDMGDKMESCFLKDLYFDRDIIGTKWGQRDISLKEKEKCPNVPVGTLVHKK